MTASSRRLKKELTDIKMANMNGFRNLDINDMNMLHWTALLVPDKEPYNKGAFKILIVFPAEYPFKPPKVTFVTKIYHPNIDESGQVCLPIIATENWKPATKTEQVVQALLDMIADPEPDHPLRADLADEYNKEFTRKHAEKRPSD